MDKPDEKQIDILQGALDKWGISFQMEMLIEECAELIQAVNKFRRNNTPDIELKLISEIADVQIMLNQMRLIYSPVMIDAAINSKMERLRERIAS